MSVWRIDPRDQSSLESWCESHDSDDGTVTVTIDSPAGGTVVELIDTTLENLNGRNHPGQSYGLTRTWRITPAAMPALALRSKVHYDDSNTEQSRHVAEVWTSQGWAEVVRIYGSDPRSTSMVSGYGPNSNDACRASAGDMAELLRDIALRTLGVPAPTIDTY